MSWFPTGDPLEYLRRNWGVWNPKVDPGSSYKWDYKPYKCPYEFVTGVRTLLTEVKIPFITGRVPPCCTCYFDFLGTVKGGSNFTQP